MDEVVTREVYQHPINEFGIGAKGKLIPTPWNLPMLHRIIEWKGHLRSSCPTGNPAVAQPPLNHVPECHLYTSVKHLQGW